MNGATEYDLLVANGLVLTLEDGLTTAEPGFVAVRDGLVAATGPMSQLTGQSRAARTLDAEGGLVMPGLINGHCHSPMTMFRGLADDLPLMTWLNDHIFPTEAAHVNHELVYWGSRLAAAETLLGGVTTLVDSYFLADQAGRAFKEAGLRTVLAQGVIDFPAPGVPDPAKNIEAASMFVERWQEESPLIRPSVFCHSPYTCSAETLVKGKQIAAEAGALFQIHVSETAAEVEESLAKHGQRPVEYLDSLGLLDEFTLAVHCVHLDDREIKILARRGTTVAVCVESNMKLASGLAPVQKFLEAGVNLTLGTDGAASNNDLNIFGEMRSLALSAKVAGLDPTVLPAEKVLRLAASGGARALGWDKLGRLVPGAPADLIVLDVSGPHLKPMYNPASHLVYAASGREVKDVVVGGRPVVENRRLLTQDLEETLAKAREIAGRIKS